MLVHSWLPQQEENDCLGRWESKRLNRMTATERSAGAGYAGLSVWCAVPCWTQTQAMSPSSASTTITRWIPSLYWLQLTRDDFDSHFPSPSYVPPPWGGLTRRSTVYVKLYDAQKIWSRRSGSQSTDEDPGNTRRPSGAQDAQDGQQELQLALFMGKMCLIASTSCL